VSAAPRAGVAGPTVASSSSSQPGARRAAQINREIAQAARSRVRQNRNQYDPARFPERGAEVPVGRGSRRRARPPAPPDGAASLSGRKRGRDPDPDPDANIDLDEDPDADPDAAAASSAELVGADLPAPRGADGDVGPARGAESEDEIDRALARDEGAIPPAAPTPPPLRGRAPGRGAAARGAGSSRPPAQGPAHGTARGASRQEGNARLQAGRASLADLMDASLDHSAEDAVGEADAAAGASSSGDAGPPPRAAAALQSEGAMDAGHGSEGAMEVDAEAGGGMAALLQRARQNEERDWKERARLLPAYTGPNDDPDDAAVRDRLAAEQRARAERMAEIEAQTIASLRPPAVKPGPASALAGPPPAGTSRQDEKHSAETKHAAAAAAAAEAEAGGGGDVPMSPNDVVLALEAEQRLCLQRLEAPAPPLRPAAGGAAASGGAPVAAADGAAGGAAAGTGAGVAAGTGRVACGAGDASGSSESWAPLPLANLTAAQLELKAQWKTLQNDKVASAEQLAFGVGEATLDMTTLTSDQIGSALLRPIEEGATETFLGSRLAQWEIIMGMKSSDIEEGMRRVDALFHNMNTVAQMEERHIALLTATERIRDLMGARGMTDITQSDGRLRVQELDRIQNNIDTIFLMKLAALDLMRGTKSHVNAKAQRLVSVRSSQQQLQSSLSAARSEWSTFAQLLDKILDHAHRWKLVRIDGQVCHPVMTSENVWTRCYQPWGETGEIIEFVHRTAASAAKDPELYGLLYDRGSFWKQIVEILKHTYDDRFPQVKPSRYWFSFSNGIYNIRDDRFYPHHSLGFKHLHDEVVGCLHFDTPFDDAEYEWHMVHGPDREDPWFNIPTPNLDKICDVQRWSLGERKWWYAGGGRMLFPLGELDNWQKMWIHLGRAGCGKTTWLKYLAGYAPRDKVGVINNNCEKIFTIQHLEKTWAYYGFDIKENWNLDQTLWNIMVDGGLLPLARKYLSAKLTDFQQHGAIASNRLMNWPDLNGQLLRRLMAHIYRRAPENMGTPQLAKDMERERAAALKKIALAYRVKAERHKNEQLTEKNLPKSMADSLALIRREANPLMSFLESDRIVLKADYYVERKRFAREFQAYCVETGIRGGKSLPTVNDAFFADVLEAKHLRLVHDNLPMPTGLAWQREGDDHCKGRKLQKIMWIFGCAFRDTEDQQPAYRPDPALPPLDLRAQARLPAGSGAPAGDPPGNPAAALRPPLSTLYTDASEAVVVPEHQRPGRAPPPSAPPPPDADPAHHGVAQGHPGDDPGPARPAGSAYAAHLTARGVPEGTAAPARAAAGVPTAAAVGTPRPQFPLAL
jgi:hypothetical protein